MGSQKFDRTNNFAFTGKHYFEINSHRLKMNVKQKSLYRYVVLPL